MGLRLTDTDIVPKDFGRTIFIYDKYFLRETLTNVFRVGFRNTKTNEMKVFVIFFDKNNVSSGLRIYLDVHAKQTWDNMVRKAKVCISIYGYHEMLGDEWLVQNLLVSDNVDEFIEMEKMRMAL
jgi:hypothetical protein